MNGLITIIYFEIGAIIGALISGVVSLLVASKQYDKSMALVEYKIEVLIEKQEKYNNVIERTAVIERDLKSCWNRYDELRDNIKEITK